MDDSESAVADLIFEGISVDPDHLLGLLGLPVVFLLAMKGDRGVFLLFVEDFVDGNSMGLGKDIFVFGLSMELGRVLLEGDRFDRFYFLHVEGLALIVEFLILAEGLSQACLVVKTDFLRVFVGLCLDPAPGFVPASPHLDFQITYHLNDHYYIPKHSDSILLHHNYHGDCQTPSPQDQLPQVQQIGHTPGGVRQPSLPRKGLLREPRRLLCLHGDRPQEA